MSDGVKDDIKSFGSPRRMHRSATKSYYNCQCWCHTRISCHWQTHAPRCITANMLWASQVNKLVTERRWQPFASKVANFQLPHLHLTYPTSIWRLRWGWSRMSFADVFGIRKLESLGYQRCCMILHLAISVEQRQVTDGPTDNDN